MLNRLQVEFSKEGRFIVATVFDGQETFRYTFGEGTSIRHINLMIPNLYQDVQWDRRMKAKFEAKLAV